MTALSMAASYYGVERSRPQPTDSISDNGLGVGDGGGVAQLNTGASEAKGAELGNR